MAASDNILPQLLPDIPSRMSRVVYTSCSWSVLLIVTFCASIWFLASLTASIVVWCRTVNLYKSDKSEITVDTISVEPVFVFTAKSYRLSYTRVLMVSNLLVIIVSRGPLAALDNISAQTVPSVFTSLSYVNFKV